MADDSGYSAGAKRITAEPYKTESEGFQGILDKAREYFGGKSAEAAALDRKMEGYNKPKEKTEPWGGKDAYKD